MCSMKKSVLRNSTNFTGKHLCLRPATLLKKETLVQVFSCQFCEISKNTFFTEHLWTTVLLLLNSNYIQAYPQVSLRQFFRSLKEISEILENSMVKVTVVTKIITHIVSLASVLTLSSGFDSPN